MQSPNRQQQLCESSITDKAAHAGGSAAYNEEQQSHGQPTATMLGYLGTSRFWFESFQNWQSEFWPSPSWWGRQCISAKSPESKPVAEPHYKTGA